MSDLNVGAIHRDGRSSFRLYAPDAAAADLVLPDRAHERRAMNRVDGGYFELRATDLPPGTRYLLQTDAMDEARPDPASLWQPLGVHGYSVLVDADLFSRKQPDWRGLRLRDMVIYELHVGTFSAAGTFDGVAEHLPALLELGVNAIELMPVNQFPGARNWGYDGVYWRAAQSSYGGPEGLVRLIDAAHEQGIAVLIDAVFNHLGPEGNYLPQFGPYFTNKHPTPWGPAINLDDRGADGVRELILASAKTWLVDYGADGLRLDAVHALKDQSATHILEELSEACARWSEQVGRPLTLIGECDLNDPRFVRPRAKGGLGLDGQWVDEYHHALRAYLTNETRGYYSDFGSAEVIERVLRDGYAYTGQHSPHRGRRFGRPPVGVSNHQFVVFGHNHDQVGNRARGERLHEHLGEDQLIALAAMVLLSPFTPMLWMGEEYAEPAPFPYFVDHGDAQVLRATREGRVREFAAFVAPGERVPDPGLAATFQSAKLSHRREGRVFDFYREAIALRRELWGGRAADIHAHGVRRERTSFTWTIPLAAEPRAVMVSVNLGAAPVRLTPKPTGTVKLDRGLAGETLSAWGVAVWLIEP